MNEKLVSEFSSIRDFFRPRIEEKTKIVSLSISDVQDKRVRELFSKSQFCKIWSWYPDRVENKLIRPWSDPAFEGIVGVEDPWS